LEEEKMKRTFIYLGSTVMAASLMSGCKSEKEYAGTLSMFYSPQMYSGYDGQHAYKIPAMIDNHGTVLPNVKWTASDPSMVDLTVSADTNSVMIQTKKAGKVTITAETNDAIGKSTLNIASYTLMQWQTGQSRYTTGAADSIRNHFRDMGTGDKGPACANASCHGPKEMGGMGIEHTPYQTGGFTDDELKGIFLNGALPASELQIPFPPEAFKAFHQWLCGDGEADGLVAYLRSLEPKDQGPINFGGRGRGDGGRPMFDGFHPPTPEDMSVPTDGSPAGD